MQETQLATVMPDEQDSMLNILRAAVEKGMDVAAIEKLTAVYERLVSMKAEKEFACAMAAFQAGCPIIPKSSRASFATKSGGTASYTYAELDEIANTIRACCYAHGLSYSWSNTIQGSMMTVTCHIRHTGGFVSSADFTTPIDGTPLMSSSQKGAATLTQAKRQSLVQALGLITGDHDTDDVDGYSAPRSSAPRITEKQSAQIIDFLDEVNADRAQFLAYIGAESIDTIPASDYRRAIAALEAKRAKNRAAT